jgi:L,D-transpeptidase YcbB
MQAIGLEHSGYAMRNALTGIGIILAIVWLPQPSLRAAFAGHGPVKFDTALQAWLESTPGHFDSNPELVDAVVRFYRARQFSPAWIGTEQLTPQAVTVLNTLINACDRRTPKLEAYLRRLESIVADIRLFQSNQAPVPLGAWLRADVAITQIALYFATQFDTEFLYPDRAALPPQQQIAAKLARSLGRPTWIALRNATCRRQMPFMALHRILKHYQAIKQLGGWAPIPEGPRLELGIEDPRVPLLRRRLIISGDLGLEGLSLDESFDDALVEGVRRFQRRHGLEADGVVGNDTLAELNTSVQERINQIKLNMIRWHSLPERLGSRYLMVNIPGFKLDVVENNQVVHSMRAIVGKRNRPTPVMSAMMTYLEINPYWNIPQKIARKDLLPKIQKDPGYLLRRNIQVFSSWKEDADVIDPLDIDWQSYSKENFPPFRLRQQPVPSNALGRVKFIFPNRHSVYIHDTPAKSLFDKNDRSFSAGCVRIEEPLTLAKYLLASQNWDDKRIDAKIHSRKRMTVVLKEPIPVHLVYLTVWADEDGTVYFFQDLYNRDRRLLAKLKQVNSDPPAFMADLMNINWILRKIDRSAEAKKSEQSAGPNTS